MTSPVIVSAPVDVDVLALRAANAQLARIAPVVLPVPAEAPLSAAESFRPPVDVEAPALNPTSV